MGKKSSSRSFKAQSGGGQETTFDLMVASVIFEYLYAVSFVKGSTLWNELPTEIKNIYSYKSYKEKTKMLSKIP